MNKPIFDTVNDYPILKFRILSEMIIYLAVFFVATADMSVMRAL